MLFTEGADRAFERMMQQKPMFHDRGSRRDIVGANIKCSHPSQESYDGDFRYRYRDFGCAYCIDFAKKSCPYDMCPHIMDNLDDLMKDPAFISAVSRAETCDTPHRDTLLMLLGRQTNKPMLA